MTLRDLLKSGIILEGYRKIQCWETESHPTVYYEGCDDDIPDEYMDRKITYIFSYTIGFHISAIGIEVEAE